MRDVFPDGGSAVAGACGRPESGDICALGAIGGQWRDGGVARLQAACADDLNRRLEGLAGGRGHLNLFQREPAFD